MAQILDLRNSGGELVILGSSIALPTSSAPVAPGAEPLYGSLRYNPDTVSLEIYGSDGGDPADWHVAATIGDNFYQTTFVGNNGTLTAPVFAFTSDTNTGLYRYGEGVLAVSSNGTLAARFSSTLINLDQDVSVAGDLSATSITITDGDPGSTSSVILGDTGDEWAVSNDSSDLTFKYNDVTMGTLTSDGALTVTSLVTDQWSIGADWKMQEDYDGLCFYYQSDVFPKLKLRPDGVIEAADLSFSTLAVNSLTTVDDISVDSMNADTAHVNAATITTLTVGTVWTQVQSVSDFHLNYSDGTKLTVTPAGRVIADTFEGLFVAPGADLAERYHADSVYEPGTVLVIGGAKEVTISSHAVDPAVAGVVSTAPGVKLNEAAGTDQTHPYLALKGRVPCKVVGPIQKGDLLVTSDVPGHAMAMNAPALYACVIGKALQDFYGARGTIEVMVS